MFHQLISHDQHIGFFFCHHSITMASSAAKFTVTATHVVKSEHQITLQAPFLLGPLDQLYHFATPVTAVWFYESPGTSLVPLERLHKAISRLLDYYPHLTGRLHIDPGTNVRTVDRLGTGVHLLEALCDATLQSFASRSSKPGGELNIFDFQGYGNALLAPWDLTLEGAMQQPLFSIQRTEFADSAVAIGMRLSHVVSGAKGFLGLYQDLAEIYRAIDDPAASRGPIELTAPPHIHPFMVEKMQHMDVEEKKKALSEGPGGYPLRDSQSAAAAPDERKGKDGSQRELNKDPFVGRGLRFSASAIATLKQQAADPNDSSSRVSSFTALTAHLWQRIHRARAAHARTLPEDERSAYSKSIYGTSVDFTRHFRRPERSFGNTFVSRAVELDSSKLEQARPWEIAKIIKDLVRHVSLDETRQLGSWIAAQPKKSDIKLGFNFNTPTLLITIGWHSFPFYSGAELEVAPTFASPIFMESLSPGMVCFVESKDGGLEAIASLTASTWALLDADEEFITTWDK